MCGIVGFLNFNTLHTPIEPILNHMAAKLGHRGPDHQGLWVNESQQIALAYRRLAIQDLSSAGHQPMISTSGRYVIVFNGEIYNFLKLRAELTALNYSWRGNSDTEVFLAVIEQWGIEKAVEKLIGMFSFALWDNQLQELHLVRDRIGVKPLYYTICNHSLLFSSELKAFYPFPQFNPKINQDVLPLFLRHSFIPAPYSIYENVYQLLPGHSLMINLKNIATPLKPKSYWSASISKENSLSQDSGDELAHSLELLLNDAIKIRMVADVPVGVFLSGGIDSSLITTLMTHQNYSSPIKSFTIGFDNPQYNEAMEAKMVAKFLQTDHHELYITPQDVQKLIPQLPTLYDEPFADSSQIPTYFVSKLAQQQVKVALTGDGGDELFGGYTRYHGMQLWQKFRNFPDFMRKGIKRSLEAIPPTIWDDLHQFFNPILPKPLQHRLMGDKLHKLAALINTESHEELHLNLISIWQNPDAALFTQSENTLPIHIFKNDINLVNSMMLYDLTHGLPSGILTKIDRATMSVGLEARNPLLDHRVVEFALALPLQYKIRNYQNKWILRKILNRYLPPKLIDRPKMGFGVPIGEWLRGPLRDWAEDLLNEKKLGDEGFFNAKVIRKTWSAHLSNRVNNQYQLWVILMFQAWLESVRRLNREKEGAY